MKLFGMGCILCISLFHVTGRKKYIIEYFTILYNIHTYFILIYIYILIYKYTYFEEYWRHIFPWKHRGRSFSKIFRIVTPMFSLVDLFSPRYLDTDVVVQGDLTLLASMNMRGHPAAAAEDCAQKIGHLDSAKDGGLVIFFSWGGWGGTNREQTAI